MGGSYRGIGFVLSLIALTFLAAVIAGTPLHEQHTRVNTTESAENVSTEKPVPGNERVTVLRNRSLNLSRTVGESATVGKTVNETIPQPGNTTGQTRESAPEEQSASDRHLANTSSDSQSPSINQTKTESKQGDQSQSEYKITARSRMIAGAPASFNITRGENPVENVTVFLNGERIGKTDSAGTVNATLPYNESITVTVNTTSDTPGFRASDLTGGVASLGMRAEVDGVYLLKPPEFRVDSPPGARAGSGSVSANFSINTNTTLTVEGGQIPSTNVGVLATIDGVPIPNATIRLDNRTVGRTDSAGFARLTTPFKQAYTIEVARGDAVGTQTVSDVRTDINVTATGFRIPGGTLRVSAKIQRRPIANATVTVDNSTVGRTDANGTLQVNTPLQNSFVIAVTRGDASGVAKVTGVYAPVVIAVGIVLLTLMGESSRRRRYHTVLTLLARRFARYSIQRVSRAFGRLVAVVTRIDDTDQRHLRSDTARRCSQPVVTDFGGENKFEGDNRDYWMELQNAWQEMIGLLPDSKSTTRAMTPGELAARSIENGYPRDAVEEIRDAFRAVRYGRIELSDAQRRRVDKAIDTLRSERGEGE